MIGHLRRRAAGMFPASSLAGRKLRQGFNIAATLADALLLPFRNAADALYFFWPWAVGEIKSGKIPSTDEIGQASCERTIVMLVVSQLHVDPRVRQEAQALARGGYRIVVIWPELASDVGRPIDWGAGITFERLPPQASRFAYRFPGFLGVEMLRAAVKYRPFAFHAHDLTTVFVALTAARQTGAYAVSDFHEWFSEHVSWSRRLESYVPLSRVQRRANKWLERFAFDRSDALVTVCRSIAVDMEHEYGNGDEKLHIVRNIPALNARAATAYPSLRLELGLGDNQLLLLYQGGIGPSRALEPVIAALALVPECVLVVRGPSIEAYADHYRGVAARSGVASGQLVLLPAIPSTDVVAACCGADVGLYTVADLCKSFRYALPNKVFEYMTAGLPMIVANYPEVKTMVVDQSVGLSFEPMDPSSIADAMRQMLSADRRLAMAERLPTLLRDIDAETEWTKIVDVYKRLESSRGIIKGLRIAAVRPVGRASSSRTTVATTSA